MSLVLLYLCLDTPRCSKEIAKILNNPHNDRNIQKILNKLEKEDLMIVEKGTNNHYTRSKFFKTNNDKLATLLINECDYLKKSAEMKKAEYMGIDLREKEEAIRYFRSLFDLIVSDTKRFLYFDETGQKGFLKLAEISDIL